MQLFDFIEGNTPLLVSMPHVGIEIPIDIEDTMTEQALIRADTDWHLHRLYDFAPALGASLIRPYLSRYVIDLNRPPDDAELYPGRDSTELCPTQTFANQPLYQNRRTPDCKEIARRRRQFWLPYHDRISLELSRLRERFGVAVLFDAHSIRSRVPRLFEGQLPELSVGTANGSSCSPRLQQLVEQVFSGQTIYKFVSNQRFRGGYITRHYGNPSQNIHTLQLELCQHTYMQEEEPFQYLPDKARRIRPLLTRLLETIVSWSQEREIRQ